MKEVVLTKSINFISQYKEYSEEELEKINYGLEGLYLTITKLVIIVLLSIILNISLDELLCQNDYRKSHEESVDEH